MIGPRRVTGGPRAHERSSEHLVEVLGGAEHTILGPIPGIRPSLHRKGALPATPAPKAVRALPRSRLGDVAPAPAVTLAHRRVANAASRGVVVPMVLRALLACR